MVIAYCVLWQMLMFVFERKEPEREEVDPTLPPPEPEYHLEGLHFPPSVLAKIGAGHVQKAIDKQVNAQSSRPSRGPEGFPPMPGPHDE